MGMDAMEVAGVCPGQNLICSSHRGRRPAKLLGLGTPELKMVEE